VKHSRRHRQPQTRYASHRCCTTFENEMIREKMNGRAEKLSRSTSRPRGTLQGGPVKFCHVIQGLTKLSMNGPRSPEWRQPFGYFCYTLRAYSNAKCQRHLFDEAHRSGSATVMHKISHICPQYLVPRASRWDKPLNPSQCDRFQPVQFRSAFRTRYFLDNGMQRAMAASPMVLF
jgi:hypothetical protein